LDRKTQSKSHKANSADNRNQHLQTLSALSATVFDTRRQRKARDARKCIIGGAVAINATRRNFTAGEPAVSDG
jgi:hypothetical protein